MCSTSRYARIRQKAPFGELWGPELVEGRVRKGGGPGWPRCPAPLLTTPSPRPKNSDHHDLLPGLRNSCIRHFRIPFPQPSAPSLELVPTTGLKALQRWKVIPPPPKKFAIYLMKRKVSECRHRRKKKMEKETTQHWNLVCATALNDYPGPLGEAGIISILKMTEAGKALWLAQSLKLSIDRALVCASCAHFDLGQVAEPLWVSISLSIKIETHSKAFLFSLGWLWGQKITSLKSLAWGVHLEIGGCDSTSVWEVRKAQCMQSRGWSKVQEGTHPTLPPGVSD